MTHIYTVQYVCTYTLVAIQSSEVHLNYTSLMQEYKPETVKKQQHEIKPTHGYQSPANLLSFVIFSSRELDVYCDWFVAALFSVDNQYPRYCNSCQSVVILLSVYTKATNFNETTPFKSFTVNNKYFKKQKYIFAS